MFAYLKYFFIGSIVLIISATFVFNAMSSSKVFDILNSQNAYGNSSLATSYKSSVWEKYKTNIADFINPANKISAADRPAYVEYSNLCEDTKRFIKNSSVLIFSFYSKDKEVFISYPSAVCGEQGAATDNAIQLRLTENLKNKRKINPLQTFEDKKQHDEVIEDAELLTPNKAMLTASVMHSTIPVLDDKQNVAGVIEIFTQMADYNSPLSDMSFNNGFFIILLFSALVSVVFYIVHRAEKIIAKQYEVNAELQSAKVNAEAENQQKSQFLANISHELRTPLNAIIGFSEIMKDEILGPLGTDQYKNYVTDIHGQGVHLLSLINDILDFSKAEAGKLDMEYEEIDLNKLVKSSLRTQEPRAKSGEVGLVEELPQEHIIMRTDPKRLKQILLNLLSNAVKFTPPHGTVTIAAWEAAADGSIGIEVSDTGIGISAKDIAKALSPFGQVDSELSRRYEGTGLGLPLTKKFIELLGGTMTLTSELGKGTKVAISLPRDNESNLPNKVSKMLSQQVHGAAE